MMGDDKMPIVKRCQVRWLSVTWEGSSFASGRWLTMGNWTRESKSKDKCDNHVWLNEVIHSGQFEVTQQGGISSGREGQHSNVLGDTTVFTSPSHLLGTSASACHETDHWWEKPHLVAGASTFLTHIPSAWRLFSRSGVGAFWSDFHSFRPRVCCLAPGIPMI